MLVKLKNFAHEKQSFKRVDNWYHGGDQVGAAAASSTGYVVISDILVNWPMEEVVGKFQHLKTLSIFQPNNFIFN